MSHLSYQQKFNTINKTKSKREFFFFYSLNGNLNRGVARTPFGLFIRLINLEKSVRKVSLGLATSKRTINNVEKLYDKYL